MSRAPTEKRRGRCGSVSLALGGNCPGADKPGSKTEETIPCKAGIPPESAAPAATERGGGKYVKQRLNEPGRFGWTAGKPGGLLECEAKKKLDERGESVVSSKTHGRARTLSSSNAVQSHTDRSEENDTWAVKVAANCFIGWNTGSAKFCRVKEKNGRGGQGRFFVYREPERT